MIQCTRITNQNLNIMRSACVPATHYSVWRTKITGRSRLTALGHGRSSSTRTSSWRAGEDKSTVHVHVAEAQHITHALACGRRRFGTSTKSPQRRPGARSSIRLALPAQYPSTRSCKGSSGGTSAEALCLEEGIAIHLVHFAA